MLQDSEVDTENVLMWFLSRGRTTCQAGSPPRFIMHHTRRIKWQITKLNVTGGMNMHNSKT